MIADRVHIHFICRVWFGLRRLGHPVQGRGLVHALGTCSVLLGSCQLRRRRADGKALGRDPRGTRGGIWERSGNPEGFLFFLRPSHLRLDICRLRRILFGAFRVRVTLTDPPLAARKPPSIRASSRATCVAPSLHSVISRGLLSPGRGQSPREELRNVAACLHACFSLPLAPNNWANTKPRRVSYNQKNPGTLLHLLSVAQK